MQDFNFLPPAVALFTLALIARGTQRSWLAPGAFFALVWTILVVFTLFFPEFFPTSGALWWIVLTVLVFYVGSLVGITAAQSGRARSLSTGPTEVLIFSKLAVVLLACFLGGAFYAILILFSGIDLRSPLEGVPLEYQLLLPFQFVGPALGGMIIASPPADRKWRWRWFSILPLLPSAVTALFSTGSTTLLGPILFYIGGYLAAQVILGKSSAPLFTPKVVAIAVLVFALFVSVLVGLHRVRIAAPSSVPIGLPQRIGIYNENLDREGLLATWDELRPYVFGQVFLFSVYFEAAWDDPPSPEYGKIVFAGPMDILGFGGQRYPFQDVEIAPGNFTNIFTMLRLPMDDFGLWGSLVWWLLVGALLGWAYTGVTLGRVGRSVLLIWCYQDTLLISSYFFRFNVIPLAYLVIGIYLFAFVRVARERIAPAARSLPEFVPVAHR